jgi:hypothetical protein
MPTRPRRWLPFSLSWMNNSAGGAGAGDASPPQGNHMMRMIMLVAVATVIIPQSASAQAVNVGGAVRGAVIRGIPTPADLGAPSSWDRKVKRHSTAPQKLRRRR